MPDKLGYLTAHELAKKLLNGPDLPLYLYEDHRERAVDVLMDGTCIYLANVDEYGMPSNPSPDHKYYYVVDRNDPYNIKCDKYGVMIRFGHRYFAEEYLKTLPDNTWRIQEADNEVYMKLYMESRK
jgi:hypothetical protein